jgi:hypothetical protein
MTSESASRRISIGTLCALAMSGLIGCVSLVPEWLDPRSGNAVTSMLKSIGFILILPGTGISMMIRGTSNPIPYWPAALINCFLYFGLAQVALFVVRLYMRMVE